ncbi:hypothetical protein ACVW1A_000238 [Bradyrhizobium sp. LB1.3]
MKVRMREGPQSGKYKRSARLIPDATMATNARNRRLEPPYKQDTAVDDKVALPHLNCYRMLSRCLT